MTRKTHSDQDTIRRLAGTIHLLRISQGLSLRDFAEKIGLEHSFIARHAHWARNGRA